ncbi:MAG TPA: PAS domain S-box protein, partial [Candidatus Cybelea sp.]|nr:PAS domain S-box protein [Candidatus Cybelea sp.]
ERVLTLTRQKMAELDQTVQLRRDNALEAALAIVKNNSGQHIMDEMRDQIGRLRTAGQNKLKEATRRANGAAAVQNSTLIGAGLLNLAFLGWALRRISREVGLREAAMLQTRQEKELLAITLASIGDAVIVTDAEGRITFLNPEAERLTGWKHSDAKDQALPNVFRTIHEQSRQPAENPVHKVLRVGSSVGLTNRALLVSRNGQETPIDDSPAPIRQPDGSLFGVVLVFRDWSIQRSAEENSARLAAIVESSEDAIISKNLDGIIQTWNIAAERLFGYKSQEIIGKPVTMLIPGDRLSEEDFILGRIRQGQKVERLETVRVAKDGRHIPVALSVSPVRDGHGRIIGASKILHDATEIVAARETLARGREELERLVEERTRKLQEMVDELQHVSYAITHDMRAPLRAMSAFAGLVAEKITAREDKETHEYCRRIQLGASRLDRLIQDALQYTKAALREMPPESVDLSKLVPDIIETYPDLQQDKADIRIEGPLPVVLGNDALLTQCFSNLLGNAVKFVAPGTRPLVRVHAEINGAITRIWVQDNGIGIPHYAHERLFKMFQRLTAEHEGTGIGLAIVRKFVERMGGKVGVESEPGQGSRFWIELRLAETQK